MPFPDYDRLYFGVFLFLAGGTERYDDKWVPVPPSERLKLSKVEGQVWLTLYQLLLSESCQQKYEFNALNKASLLKVRRELCDTCKHAQRHQNLEIPYCFFLLSLVLLSLPSEMWRFRTLSFEISEGVEGGREGGRIFWRLHTLFFFLSPPS